METEDKKKEVDTPVEETPKAEEPATEVKEPIPPEPSLTKDQADEILTTLKSYADTAKKLNDSLEASRIENQKLKEEIEVIKSKQTQITYDEKAKIEGYYDFDVAHNKLVSEDAITSKQMAFKDFDTLNLIFK